MARKSLKSKTVGSACPAGTNPYAPVRLARFPRPDTVIGLNQRELLKGKVAEFSNFVDARAGHMREAGFTEAFFINFYAFREKIIMLLDTEGVTYSQFEEVLPELSPSRNENSAFDFMILHFFY